MNKQRMYHVYITNERNGVEVRMSAAPVTHDEGCAWLKKISDQPWRRKFLREVVEPQYLGTDSDGLACYQLPFQL